MYVDYLASFSMLLLLEVILGVDNIIFISILVEKLPVRLRSRIRNLGIGLAVLTRIGLVFSVTWLMSLTEPFVTVFDRGLSGKDLILIVGGAFLLVKSFKELLGWLLAKEKKKSALENSVTMIVLQIIAIDAVFSFDSVITAVALVHNVEIIIAAIVISAIIMLAVAEKIQITITAYPGLKLLALLFLILLGGLLVVEGYGLHVDKSYLYVALAFGLTLEICHILLDRQLTKDKQSSEHEHEQAPDNQLKNSNALSGDMLQ
ncbi:MULTISPECIES: TerC family protein [unclassified Vibrio]|uniref:TerC family protein n=1 Tax=unclassified Vibrio TaxID=2614977 RepID=UPI00159D8C99|nr:MULTISPECIES: TerC family protein [unclassified Vibrio]NVN82400.1 TerC family protein [Vibrio sp. Scap16]QLE92944.1 TerC family protein [Vibrio sp. Scap24]